MDAHPDVLAASASEDTAPVRRSVLTGTGLLEALRVLAPFGIVYGTFVSLTWHAGHPMTNNDTYFHLRFGSEFLTGAWSLQNPSSPTVFGTQEWVPTQWLPQVLMAQVEDWTGLAGVAFLQGLFHLGLALGLWLLARSRTGPLGAACVLAIALLASSPGLSMRPQVLSYLLVAITTAAWLRTRDDGRPRWWLVPLTWLWAMCHGMWPVGLVIGAVALVGFALDRAASGRSLARLALVPAASAVAAALTPVGPSLYPAVLLVGSRGKYFAEWQPTNFLRLSGVALLVLAGLVLLRMLRGRAPVAWTDALLVGLACGWAIYTTRTVVVAAMMLVPIAAQVFGNARTPVPRTTRRETYGVALGFIGCLVALAVAVPRSADRPPEDPAWSRVIDDLPSGTRVINDWDRGGWMMWRWPDLNFVMNGYGDIYTDDELERNFRLDGAGTGWVSDAKRTGAEYALLVPATKLAYGLELQGWKVVHRDDDLMLLSAPPEW